MFSTQHLLLQKSSFCFTKRSMLFSLFFYKFFHLFRHFGLVNNESTCLVVEITPTSKEKLAITFPYFWTNFLNITSLPPFGYQIYTLSISAYNSNNQKNYEWSFFPHERSTFFVKVSLGNYFYISSAALIFLFASARRDVQAYNIITNISKHN